MNELSQNPESSPELKFSYKFFIYDIFDNKYGTGKQTRPIFGISI